MKELIVFDLDGVLINSKDNMRESWESVQKTHKVTVSFNDYFKHIGKPFHNILTDLGIDESHDKIKLTYDLKSKSSIDDIKPYPYVIEVLNTLSLKYKLAIVTSKSKDRTEQILKSFPKFDYVCSPCETLRGKPHGDQLDHVMKICKATPEKTIFVGDMIFDKQCAENCGVDFYYATWGYGELKCKNNLKDFRDLLLV